MRLLLTSSGFREEDIVLRNTFFNLVKKQPKEVRVAFIPTASVVEDDRSFMIEARKELEDMDIPAENITDLELDHVVTVEELRDYDVVFVDGGNTFYLLQKVQESKFDVALKKYLDQDLGVYVGVSAGTVLAGPDIEFVKPWDDKGKAAELKSTKGLGYTKEAYSPHYKDDEREILEEWRTKVRYPIKELQDGQAVVIEGNTKKLIE